MLLVYIEHIFLSQLSQCPSVAQVYAALTAWRDRDGPKAYVGTLEKILTESNMNDVALMLYP